MCEAGKRQAGLSLTGFFALVGPAGSGEAAERAEEPGAAHHWWRQFSGRSTGEAAAGRRSSGQHH